MPRLTRTALAAAAATCLTLTVPTAAGASVSPKAAPMSGVSCSSGAAIGWLSGNRVYASGWITCFRPISQVLRNVDATLTLNGTAVQYGRASCSGTADGDTTCSVQSPAQANPTGIQTWCTVSASNYDDLYNATKRVCWNG